MESPGLPRAKAVKVGDTASAVGRAPDLPQDATRVYDYDNNPVTFVLGVLGSWGAVALFGYLYASGTILRVGPIRLPVGASAALAILFVGTSFYFLRLLVVRRRHPHRIVVTRDAIEVPSSRHGSGHTTIPYGKIRSIEIKELGAGFQVLDIFYGGTRFRIAENVFEERAHFREIVAALDAHHALRR